MQEGQYKWQELSTSNSVPVLHREPNAGGNNLNAQKPRSRKTPSDYPALPTEHSTIDPQEPRPFINKSVVHRTAFPCWAAVLHMARTNKPFHVEQTGTSDDLYGEITVTNTPNAKIPRPLTLDWGIRSSGVRIGQYESAKRWHNHSVSAAPIGHRARSDLLQAPRTSRHAKLTVDRCRSVALRSVSRETVRPTASRGFADLSHLARLCHSLSASDVRAMHRKYVWPALAMPRIPTKRCKQGDYGVH